MGNNHVSLSLCYKISSKWSCEPQPVIQDIFKIIMWVSACAKDIFKLWMRLQHEWLKNAENNRGSQLRWHRLRATAARAWSVAGFWWTNGWAQSALLQSWVLVMAGWTDWSLDKGIVACDSGGGSLDKAWAHYFQSFYWPIIENGLPLKEMCLCCFIKDACQGQQPIPEEAAGSGPFFARTIHEISWDAAAEVPWCGGTCFAQVNIA